MTAVIELPARSVDDGARYWAAVTGYTPSSVRREGDDVLVLVPGDGDAFLEVQGVASDRPGCHVHLHVADVTVATDRTVREGGVLLDQTVSHRGMRSPSGIAFCLVPAAGGSARPEPAQWGSGRSLVDQVCLDIPSAGYEDECDFWARVTGWPWGPVARPEFRYLPRPPELPLRLLLQRCDAPDARAGAHLDLACDDVAAEARRHAALGAMRVRSTADWVTLRGPADCLYCVTRRNPDTGRLS